MKRKLIDLKWSLLPVLLVLMVVSSCKKNFLDRRPLGRYVDDDLPAGSFDTRVFGAYALMRAEGFNNHLYLGIQSYRSDEAKKGSSASDGAIHEQMYDDFQYDKSNDGIKGYWTDHYALIIAANAIIDTINKLPSPDPATLVNKAEAKFMRAFAFFDLARAFGRVPKVDFKVNVASDVNIKKVDDVSEIFALIDEDLTEAATILPLDWSSYPGRLTRGAALALHAKTYLWNRNWGAALAMAKEVIGLNKYSLVSSYGSQFRKAGENGPESIFEIQALYTQTLTTQGIIYTNVQGVRGAGAWDLGWGWNVPTTELVDEYEAGDPRRVETILYSGQVDPLYNENVPPVPTVDQPYWNKKVYTDPADRASTNNRFGPWMNHRILRYADVLLMAAEAANELGGAQNTTDALDWLEKIRARARAGNAAILPAVTTTVQADLRMAIIHERYVEMAMEEQRFWDLVRWGSGTSLPNYDVTVLHAAGKAAYAVKHRLLPIPQSEIDKSGGTLIQNPDY